MPAEKIYYAVIILLSAVSVLLSPFFMSAAAVTA